MTNDWPGISKEFLRVLYRRNRLLTAIGWLHCAILVATIFLVVFDGRQVMGVNTWVKPMKFMFSLTLYLWTIAWFSAYVNRPRWRIRTISIVIAVVVVVETACLLIQAGRGTTSHYNVATDFDAAIFQTMGIMIYIDMLMGFFLLLMFSKPRVSLEPLYVWGIRLGLVLFLAGGLVGTVMIANNAHTFGAPDGGPGLPILNWSTVAGDMRIAHGLALHGLQVIPFVAYLIARAPRMSSPLRKYGVFGVFVACYCLAVYGTFAQALAGVPLIT
jgi:hypothetical protein